MIEKKKSSINEDNKEKQVLSNFIEDYEKEESGSKDHVKINIKHINSMIHDEKIKHQETFKKQKTQKVFGEGKTSELI